MSQQITTPQDKHYVHTQFGVVTTVEDATQAFVETVARIRVCQDFDAAPRPQDEDDQLALGDALTHTLNLELAELYANLGEQITEQHKRFRAEATRP